LKVVRSDYRPSPRTLAVALAVIAVISVFGVLTNQNGLAAFVTVLIGGGVIAWWIVRRKR